VRESWLHFLISSPMEAGKSHADIVDTAVNAGSFNTLVTAVKAAGLVDTKGWPFTVFLQRMMPLPAYQGTVESLLNDIPPTQILTYHVISGLVMSSDVVKLDSAPTVRFIVKH